MVATIVLLHCRTPGWALQAMCASGMTLDDTLIPQLSPLAWDYINFAGGRVWSDALSIDAGDCPTLTLILPWNCGGGKWVRLNPSL